MNDKSPSILYNIPIIRDLFEGKNDLDFNPKAKKRAIIILSLITIFIFVLVFAISLAISKHNNNLVKVITVPNCVSSSINEAKALLEESEITEDKYTFISTPSRVEDKDKIINQSIEAGTEIPENQVLQLFFGDGSLIENDTVIPIDGISFEHPKITMNVGDVQALNVKVNPENSTEQYFITCDNYRVAFTDDNNIYAFSPGEAKLIAKTVEGKIVGECQIVVKQSNTTYIQSESSKSRTQVSNTSQVSVGESSTSKTTTTIIIPDSTTKISTAVVTTTSTAAKPTTITTKSPTTTTSSEKQYEKGDINGDGDVTYEDFNWLCDYLAGEKQLTEDQKRRADVDGSGKPDEGDKSKLLKLIP